MYMCIYIYIYIIYKVKATNEQTIKDSSEAQTAVAQASVNSADRH